MEAVFSDRSDVLFIDIDKAYIVAGAREPAADDPADGAGADHDHAIAHAHLRYLNATNICTNARNMRQRIARAAVTS